MADRMAVGLAPSVDRARCRRGFEARGSVDGVADDRECARRGSAQLARDHHAGVDADAQ
jgi:hypothetical protein